jgi:hypothetical protein
VAGLKVTPTIETIVENQTEYAPTPLTQSAVLETDLSQSKDNAHIVPAKLSQGQIGRLAKKLMDVMDKSELKDLLDLVKHYGGTIKYVNAPDNPHSSAKITVRGTNNFEIALPRYLNSSQQHYSIAHLLPHYFLHLPYNTPHAIKGFVAFHFATAKDLASIEASVMALLMLMPQDKFPGNEVDPRDIARRFVVSEGEVLARRRLAENILPNS